MVCKVGETAQKEVEKAPRTCNTVPRSFQRLFDALLQEERTARRMKLIKAVVALVCLFSMVCNSTISEHLLSLLDPRQDRSSCTAVWREAATFDFSDSIGAGGCKH